MRRLLHLALGVYALARVAVSVNAASDQVIYKVVAVPPSQLNVVGVAVGQDVYPLKADDKVPMLYTGRGPSNSPYRYVVLESANDKKMVDFEPFERPAIVQANETFNEVYGRPWNKLELTQLPKVYDFTSQRNDPGENKLFEEGAIATLHLAANEAQVMAMHDNKMSKDFSVMGTLTYISYDNVQQLDDVEFKIAGHSSRNWSKVPYKVKIPKRHQTGLYHRWDLKLRSEASDPTMLREKLYSDMLKSVGVLAPRGSYVRLYINDKPYGLFLMMDNVQKASYIRETVHGGDATELGSLIKGDAGEGDYAANFDYRGDNLNAYDEQVYKVEFGPQGEPSPMVPLIQFMRMIGEYNPDTAPSDARVIDLWSTHVDVIRYIRQMAIEWIGGNWDGSQYSGNNFVIYRHPTTKQYSVIPMDFDYTFGNGIEADQQALMTGNWHDFIADRKIHSFLWEKILATPYLRHVYGQTLAEINEKLSHPKILLSRIDSLAYMIQKEAAWDHALGGVTNGQVREWLSDNYLETLERSSGAEDDFVGLKEWVVAKYEAIKADVGGHSK